MELTRHQLTTRFAAAIQEGAAALFVGAGLSRPAGYVDWKGLLEECAVEIGLDLSREHDLVAVAQYYLNSRNRQRGRLNQIVQSEFSKPGAVTINHEIIARLAVPTIWTTNFDTLLEDSIRAAGRTADVKRRDEDFSTTTPGHDVTVCKMHGDVATPDEVILCKEDFERYARKHAIFQNQLEGDLISKTFLFLGFSFTDPNLDYMLGHLRTLLEDSKREHYAIMRRVAPSDFKSTDDYDYERKKQQLRIQDLERYGILTLLVDEYGEIPEILGEIERRYALRTVFISGSASDFAPYGEERLQELAFTLGSRLISDGFTMMTGYGVGIGGALITGALKVLFEQTRPQIDKRLLLRPFPQQTLDGMSREALWTRYRQEMIAEAGFVVVIAGNRADAPVAPGVLEEAGLARTAGKLIIPVAATGGAAAALAATLEEDHVTPFGEAQLTEPLRVLADTSSTPDAIVDGIMDILTFYLKDKYGTTSFL